MRALIASLTLGWCCLQLDAHAAESGPAVTVFAAASLSDVLQTVSTEFTRAGHAPVRLSFAASSALARQIESGARVDVFVSADQEWMDYLAAKKLIDPATRRNVVANRLALVAPADSSLTLRLQAGSPLQEALGANGRLATGDPDSVPVGRYARAALTSLGLWTQLEGRLVRAENVRAALAFVARGEVPLGIVYETDAKAEPRVKTIDLFPPSSHPPITYPAAVTSSGGTEARAYLAFLASPAARAIFSSAGFQPPTP